MRNENKIGSVRLNYQNVHHEKNTINDKPRRQIISSDLCLRIIKQLRGQYSLMANLMLCCGMRPQECLSLRVRNFDFIHYKITIPGRLGTATRTVFIPIHLNSDLQKHITDLNVLHKKELSDGFARVNVPVNAANTQTHNKWSEDFEWQWMFSRRSLSLEHSECSREQTIVTALSDRMTRILQSGGMPSNAPLGVDIFWRCYLAGS